MKVFCCQFDIAWEDKAANLAKVKRLLSEAAAPPGSLVLLPEMFATGFSMNVAGIAESPQGSTEKALADLAREFRIYLLAGVVTADPDGKGRNQSVVFSPTGELHARYSKMQPFTLGGEADHYTAGTHPVTFRCGEWLVAPFVCYDLRFPELFREAARQRPHLYTVIASWPVKRIGHWVKLLQARAIENQAYVAGANRIGTDPSLSYSGRSILVDPHGEILADAGEREGVISAELSLEGLLEYRRALPFLEDMRASHVQSSI